MADARGFLKLSHGLPEHPKIEEAGGDAAWLHICALAYCSRNLSDGFFPASIIGRLSDRDNPKQLASTLLSVGLWHDASNGCGRCPQVPLGRYLIHDYLEHQTSAERAREISAKRAVAGQKGGQAKSSASNGSSNLLGKLSSKSLAEVEVEVEVDQRKELSTSSSSADADEGAPPRSKKPKRKPRVTPERFDDFWRVYPKRVGKIAAEKAFANAVADGIAPDRLIAGAYLYAMEHKFTEPEFIKHPATWLNAGCWDDEPDPAYAPPLISGPSEAFRHPGNRPYAEVAAEQLAY